MFRLMTFFKFYVLLIFKNERLIFISIDISFSNSSSSYGKYSFYVSLTP